MLMISLNVSLLQPSTTTPEGDHWEMALSRSLVRWAFRLPKVVACRASGVDDVTLTTPEKQEHTGAKDARPMASFWQCLIHCNGSNNRCFADMVNFSNILIAVFHCFPLRFNYV